jgi:hypothetical protein
MYRSHNSISAAPQAKETFFLLNDQSRTIVIDNNANLNLKQKSGKKITWIDAFLIYTSIYTAAHSALRVC